MSRKKHGRKPSEALLDRSSDPRERAQRRRGVELARLRLELAQAVHDLRERRGMTQTDLARQVGTRQPNISRLERGEAGGLPSLDLLHRVAHALGGRLDVRIVRPASRKRPSRTTARRKPDARRSGQTG